MASAGAAELPADFAAQCRHFPDNDKLARALWLAAAVDPQTFLDREVAAATAEVPWRRRARAQDRAHAVGGDRRFNPGREVEAHRIRRGLANLLAALGDQLVGAAQFLAVIAEHQAALMDE